MNGRGGGRADVAQAGGSDGALLTNALDAAPDVIGTLLTANES